MTYKYGIDSAKKYIREAVLNRETSEENDDLSLNQPSKPISLEAAIQTELNIFSIQSQYASAIEQSLIIYKLVP